MTLRVAALIGAAAVALVIEWRWRRRISRAYDRSTAAHLARTAAMNRGDVAAAGAAEDEAIEAARELRKLREGKPWARV